MRAKQEILEATHRNALNSREPKDIALIHSLHILEVLLDIRDILAPLTQAILSNIIYLGKKD